MQKFNNKFRIPSNRKPGWDYSSDAYYFITIVCHNMECNLGTIHNAEMHLSDFGNIVHQQWFKSFEIRAELILDHYIIMPNHLHAIIILQNPSIPVQTHGRASLQKSPIHRQPKSISSFFAGFKSAVNSKIDDYIDTHHLEIPKYNRNNHFFQPNYHDHIIRNDQEYHRIAEYITTNPKNWNTDKFRPT